MAAAAFALAGADGEAGAGDVGSSAGGASAATRSAVVSGARMTGSGRSGVVRAALGRTASGTVGAARSGAGEGAGPLGTAGRNGDGVVGPICGMAGERAAVTSGRAGKDGGRTVSLPRCDEMISTIIGRFCSRRRSSSGTGASQASARSAPCSASAPTKAPAAIRRAGGPAGWKPSSRATGPSVPSGVCSRLPGGTAGTADSIALVYTI